MRTMGKGLPVTIFRPAIVIPTYLEPISGWIDNMYGPTGIIVGVGSGLLRVFHVCPENFAELVPVDMCVNALLASAWDVHQVTYNEPPVYNYVASPQNPITWRQYCDMGIESGRTMPMNNTIWFYSFTMTSSKFVSIVLTLLYHTIPAMLMDAGLMAFGKKPKYVHTISLLIRSEFYFQKIFFSYCCVECYEFIEKSINFAMQSVTLQRVDGISPITMYKRYTRN